MSALLSYMLLSPFLQSGPLPLRDNNLRVHPAHPGFYEPIVNFANPQDPQIVGPLRCDTPVIDFGRVRAGQSLYVTFPVTNTSNRTIKVRALQSCSCPYYPLGPEFLQPGQTGYYSMTLNIKNTHGPVSKSMTIKVIAEHDGPSDGT